MGNPRYIARRILNRQGRILCILVSGMTFALACAFPHSRSGSISCIHLRHTWDMGTPSSERATHSTSHQSAHNNTPGSRCFFLRSYHNYSQMISGFRRSSRLFPRLGNIPSRNTSSGTGRRLHSYRHSLSCRLGLADTYRSGIRSSRPWMPRPQRPRIHRHPRLRSRARSNIDERQHRHNRLPHLRGLVSRRSRGIRRLRS